jgi:serine protease AprX
MTGLIGLALVAALAGSSLVASSSAAPRSAPRVPSLDAGLPTTGGLQHVVVSGAVGAAELVRSAVAAVGGTSDRSLPIVDGVSATVPADRLLELTRQPGVTAVTADRKAKLYASSWDDTLSASSYVWTSQAGQVVQSGKKGAGIGVAVLDTGVSAVNDLAGRIVAGPDLSGEQRNAVDSYGHGTVMAGIIAGNGADGGSTPRTGIAPAAHIVSVKVAGANGVADVSTVLAAMSWVGAFKDTYGIRVMNLSWGVPSTQAPSVDPLNYAVQRLWTSGVTVLVAAGNSGPSTGTIMKPGDDPMVITVGAYDDRSDLNVDNDVVPAWSSQGPTAQGVAKPDLVAPGRSLVATRSPGSTVERENPKALVSPSYIKGSGSSEATAVTAGAAALMLSNNPALTPDQVKAALVSTARPIANVSRNAQGAGRLQLTPALAKDVSAVLSAVSTATGAGTLQGSRGRSPLVTVTCDLLPKVLNDESTSWCLPWDGNAWTGNAWTGNAWTGNAWTGNAWTGNAWTGNAWTGATWSGNAWTGNAWTGNAWTGNAWTGMAWAGNAWTGNAWTSAEYEFDEFLSAFWGDKTHWWKKLPGEESELSPSELAHQARQDRDEARAAGEIARATGASELAVTAVLPPVAVPQLVPEVETVAVAEPKTEATSAAGASGPDLTVEKRRKG